MHLFNFPVSICWPSSLSRNIFCNKAFSGGRSLVFFIIFFLWNSYYALFMTFLTCLDEAYLKEGNVRMWLSLVFLCPRDKELGGGGILIYPCPSGYRYMVCSAISSYSFAATALIFYRMFIHIIEVCMSIGFWFSSNILKTTGSWT